MNPRIPYTEPLMHHERVMVAARRLTHCEMELRRALSAARDALTALELTLGGGQELIPPHGGLPDPPQRPLPPGVVRRGVRP